MISRYLFHQIRHVNGYSRMISTSHSVLSDVYSNASELSELESTASGQPSSSTSTTWASLLGKNTFVKDNKVMNMKNLRVLFDDDNFCFVYKPHNLATSGVDETDFDFHNYVKVQNNNYTYY